MQYRRQNIFNDFKSPYGELRKKEDRPVVYVQRLRAILIEVYKAYLTLAQNICVTFLRSTIRFIQLDMIRCWFSQNASVLKLSIMVHVFTLLGMREQRCGTHWIHILKR